MRSSAFQSIDCRIEAGTTAERTRLDYHRQIAVVPTLDTLETARTRLVVFWRVLVAGLLIKYILNRTKYTNTEIATHLANTHRRS